MRELWQQNKFILIPTCYNIPRAGLQSLIYFFIILSTITDDTTTDSIHLSSFSYPLSYSYSQPTTYSRLLVWITLSRYRHTQLRVSSTYTFSYYFVIYLSLVFPTYYRFVSIYTNTSCYHRTRLRYFLLNIGYGPW